MANRSRAVSIAAVLGLGWGVAAAIAPGQSQADTCDPDLKLPAGFCATIWADNLGHVRHLAMGLDGTVYVNTSTSIESKDSPPPGGFLIAIKNPKNYGLADIVKRFGPTPADGVKGGGGIQVFNGYVYADLDDKIVRYPIPKDGWLPTEKTPEIVVSGLPLITRHTFAIDEQGQLFVLANPRLEAGVPGGIWKYSADALNQLFSPDAPFAANIHHGAGLAFDRSGNLYAIQRGSDAPNKGKAKARRAADQLLSLSSSGQRTVITDFPSGSAAADMLIYNRTAFPRPFPGGAFVNFRGSLPNTTPRVEFQPLTDGKPNGKAFVFADGFAGGTRDPLHAKYRPSGLLYGGGGALYIADEVKGRIWKVTYAAPASLPQANGK